MPVMWLSTGLTATVVGPCTSLPLLAKGEQRTVMEILD